MLVIRFVDPQHMIVLFLGVLKEVLTGTIGYDVGSCLILRQRSLCGLRNKCLFLQFMAFLNNAYLQTDLIIFGE